MKSQCWGIYLVKYHRFYIITYFISLYDYVLYTIRYIYYLVQYDWSLQKLTPLQPDQQFQSKSASINLNLIGFRTVTEVNKETNPWRDWREQQDMERVER